MRPLAGLEPEEQREVWCRATALNPSPTAAQVEQAKAIVSAEHAPHVSNNSGENEWYTPAKYIAMARRVMGQIDLDPASTLAVNEVIKANTFYSKDEDGLSQKWFGKVWMNPPYEQPLIFQFSEKISDCYDRHEITEAIALVNNATETKWFQRMAWSATAVCFPLGRVKFWHPEREREATPLQGQAFLYFGDKTTQFSRIFKNEGRVYER